MSHASDDQLLQRPIIILGAPRSGTTMLGHVLSHHPDLYYIEEPRLTWRFGNDRKSDLLRADDARPEVVAHIRRAFADRIRAAGKSRLLEKTPSTALRPGFVHRVFPDAIFIHTIRNGYDSALSIEQFWNRHAHGVRNIAPGRVASRLKEVNLRRLPHYAREFARRIAPKPLRGAMGHNVWGPRIPGIDALLRDLDLIEVAALQWRWCVEHARAYGQTLPADQYLEFRLEDFSLEKLREVLHFVQLDESPAVLDDFQANFRPRDATARRPHADPAKLQQLAPWVTPAMAWLGYEQAEAHR